MPIPHFCSNRILFKKMRIKDEPKKIHPESNSIHLPHGLTKPIGFLRQEVHLKPGANEFHRTYLGERS